LVTEEAPQIDLIIDYGGKFRYASLTTFHWFDVDAETWLGGQYDGYELVTSGFLAAFKLRLDTQNARSDGYSRKMKERLHQAWQLWRELQPENLPK